MNKLNKRKGPKSAAAPPKGEMQSGDGASTGTLSSRPQSRQKVTKQKKTSKSSLSQDSLIDALSEKQGELDAFKDKERERVEKEQREKADAQEQLHHVRTFAQSLDATLKDIRHPTLIWSIQSAALISSGLAALALLLFPLIVTRLPPDVVHDYNCYIGWFSATCLLMLTLAIYYFKSPSKVAYGRITFKSWIDSPECDMRPLANKKSDMTLDSQLMKVVITNFDNREVQTCIICAQLLSQCMASGVVMGTQSVSEATRAIRGSLRRISNVNQQRQYSLIGAMIPQDTAYVAAALLVNYHLAAADYPSLGF